MTIFLYIGFTKNLEIGNTCFEFCPISRDWCKLGKPNLAETSLMKCNCMLQNARDPAFTVLALLRENQLAGITRHPTQIRVNIGLAFGKLFKYNIILKS